MNRFFIATLAVAAGSFAVGCSGVSSALLDDGGLATHDDSGTSTAPDAGTTEPDATTPQDASTGEDAHVVDATPDLWVGPADTTIACGPQLGCSAQTEVCCWHMASSTTPYECVANAGDCAGTYDVPMSCSSPANCESQGNAGYQCCATGGNFGFGQCSAYDVATVVACKPTCDPLDYELGCDKQKQNCSDSLRKCVTSQCTVPGDTMCY